jgi:ABC-type hemin transport system substrate-binding protein
VARRYTTGEPSQLIAEELHIGKTTVLKILRAANVAVRAVGVRY